MTNNLQTTFQHVISWIKSVWIPIDTPPKFISEDPIDESFLFKEKVGSQTGDKSLSKPMMFWFTYAYMRHPISMS